MQSADIVPTIADLLGVDVPWRLDGVSALDESKPPPAEKGLTPEESWAQRQKFDAALPEKSETCRHLERLVGRRGDAYDLFALGPNADMVGRAVEEFSQGEVPDVQVETGRRRAVLLPGRPPGRAGPALVARGRGRGRQRPHCRGDADLPLRRFHEHLDRASAAPEHICAARTTWPFISFARRRPASRPAAVENR